ncbi:GumC family protein [Psychroflexus halocasei]|uniref:non-specific protein-tyrosine kinase n=1 Tax=Psychroflexus halocasei TaxID=908615 RepID=A0A1H3W2H1_9FLAO|nr:tyrosine-protein kinase family protein [Psychroflexus halocasei]SDZ81180.1 capsular exopolysaccharide family [Psychroflexus halocasei]
MDNNYQQNAYQDTENNSGEDIKKTIFQYLKYWPWFIISVIITVGLAYMYMRYSPAIYKTSSKIKILKEQEGLDLQGLQGASPLIDMSSVNLDNEIQILKSRRIAKKVIEDLRLQTKYYTSGTIKDREIWDNQVPYIIDWSASDSSDYKELPMMNLKFETQSNFKLIEVESDFKISAKLGDTIEYSNQKVDNIKFSIGINPFYKGDLASFIEKSYSFKKSNLDQTITNLTKNLVTETVDQRADIITIIIEGENESKNEDILDELMKQFNQDGVDDNRLIAKRTQDFVEKRLDFIVEELDTVETGIVDYKKANDLTDIKGNTELLFEKVGKTEMKRFEIETQVEIANEFKNLVNNQESISLLPANLGIESNEVNSLTKAYNDLVLERNEIMVSSTKDNPVIKSIDQRLKEIRKNINRSIDNYTESLKISLKNTRTRESIFSSTIDKIPNQEKEIRSIERERLVKEKLFLFLLQKREEATLTYAITAPVIKVVDFAYTQPNPVSPKKKIIALAALILGLIIPFGILYLKFLLDTKLNSADAIKRELPDIPVVGEIPLTNVSEFNMITPTDRSPLAESFRILRTNINFINLTASQKKKHNQVIYVTSSTKGEGKTFASINLASVTAHQSKSTLLVGCDIRNPQLHNYFGLDKNVKGLSNYLYDTSISIDDVTIENVNNSDLDVILSGEIPPNPSEILLSSRFDEFIEDAKKKYKYIIVDTAPTILVTDTIMISDKADITLYLTRADYTDLRLLDHIKDLKKHKKLKNIGIILNGVKQSGRYSYNYGYGYGYNEDTSNGKKNWKFWKK